MTFNPEGLPTSSDLPEKSQQENDPVAVSKDVLTRMQIEREGDKTIPHHAARAMVTTVINSEKLAPYFNLSDDEIPIVKKVAEYKKYQDMNLAGPTEPTAEEQKIYGKVLFGLMQAPASDPHFAVKDKAFDDIFHLCIENGKPLTVREREGKFYVLYKIPDSFNENELKDVEKRMNNLSESPYFPKMRIQGKNIEVEYIPSTQTATKGEDVSAVYDFCEKIGFGIDTNATNFLRYKNQLIYTDHDVIEWAFDPSTHPFDKTMSHIRKSVW